MFSRVVVACLAVSAVLTLLPAAPSAAEEKPYKIKDGKVDQHVYNGWRRFGDSCLRCHGPDAAGSSYAPDLTASLKTLSEDTFKATVMGGRINIENGQQKVMPSFADVEDVVTYLDDIYAYLKARSDGALDRGRPQRLKE
jgi:mono/diheme cytochrome c family protein